MALRMTIMQHNDDVSFVPNFHVANFEVMRRLQQHFYYHLDKGFSDGVSRLGLGRVILYPKGSSIHNLHRGRPKICFSLRGQKGTI